MGRLFFVRWPTLTREGIQSLFARKWRRSRHPVVEVFFRKWTCGSVPPKLCVANNRVEIFEIVLREAARQWLRNAF